MQFNQNVGSRIYCASRNLYKKSIFNWHRVWWFSIDAEFLCRYNILTKKTNKQTWIDWLGTTALDRANSGYRLREHEEYSVCQLDWLLAANYSPALCNWIGICCDWMHWHFVNKIFRIESMPIDAGYNIHCAIADYLSIELVRTCLFITNH